mgnify:CR=1 FL=1
MANALGTLFQNIASAIRAKTGETGSMKPAEFPEKIASIETGGGSDVDIQDDVKIVPDFSRGNFIIDLTESNQAIRSGYVEKPSTLTPGNIKKDVTIAGVTGSFEASTGTNAKSAFYGCTFANMQYTIADSVTTSSGGGGMTCVMKSSIPSTVTHILAVPDDGYTYTKGCAWDWLGGCWVYDYRVHKGETFKVPHDGTTPSWEILDSSYAYGLISKSYEDSDGLEFTAANSYGNCTLRLFNSSGTIATYKIIVG